jgi:hypothetical protein
MTVSLSAAIAASLLLSSLMPGEAEVFAQVLFSPTPKARSPSRGRNRALTAEKRLRDRGGPKGWSTLKWV